MVDSVDRERFMESKAELDVSQVLLFVYNDAIIPLAIGWLG